MHAFERQTDRDRQRDESSLDRDCILPRGKMWQLRCIATWGGPTQRELFSALSVTPVPSLKSVILSNAASFYCWYITLLYDLDLWPLTLNIIQRMSRDQSLYQVERNLTMRGWLTDNLRSLCLRFLSGFAVFQYRTTLTERTVDHNEPYGDDTFICVWGRCLIFDVSCSISKRSEQR